MKVTSARLCVICSWVVVWWTTETNSFRVCKPLTITHAPFQALKQNDVSENEDSKAVAMTSLEKLMRRHRDEALQTEMLIEQFSDALSSEKKNLDEIIEQGTRASSIVSAFDYGFQSRSGGASTATNFRGKRPAGEGDHSELFEKYGGPPDSFFSLGVDQFNRNLDAMRGEYKDEEPMKLKLEQISVRKMLKKLTLNTTAVWEREKKYTDMPPSPLIIQIPYNVLCYFLDYVFEGRYVPSRFFFLETVARMPYFSYLSCLHLYETLGFWRNSADMKRVHFAEEWNEFHHLLIMESIGGDQHWWVRFLSQHSAIAYYFILLHLFFVSPTLSYKFSEMLETHAVHTYSQFLDENEDLLKQLPPPVAAVDYYTIGAFDPLFDEYKTTTSSSEDNALQMKGRSTNTIRSLYDVFVNIRDDEGEHVKTMEACLDPTVVVRSAAAEKNFLLAAAGAALIGYLASTGVMSEIPFFSEELVDEAFVEELEHSAPILLEEGGIIGFLISSIFQVFQRLL